jgi:hypothetical protein
MPATHYPEYIQLADVVGNAAVTKFNPIAYYEKHLDRIRIELRDCSMTEVRVNEMLTVLYDNYPDPSSNQDRYAGLMIKGVKHYFKQWEIPLEGVVFVTDILNRVLKDLPEDAGYKRPVEATEAIQSTAANIELTLTLTTESV